MKEKSNGITLVALVVTIVVLMILAGISIGALTGENGIIGQAKEGKDATEISEEKEILNISAVQTIKESEYGDIVTEIFREKLKNNAGEGKTEVIDNEETLIAKFIEKNRYYEIDKDGNVDGPKEVINDDNAGDLSKDGKADGSEEKPYEINCIEDLVTFSIMVNGGKTELGIEANDFEGKNVVLMRTLDFKSIFSYNDYATKFYGDLNADGIVEDIKTELTKTDEGCIGFTPIGDSDKGMYFKGIFDGKNNEICNLYVNSGEKNAGLFNGIYSSTITNLGMENVTLKTNNFAGGIIAEQANACVIKSCYIEGTSKFFYCKYAGGIVGKGNNGNKILIENCYSIGDLHLQEVQIFGGVLGNSESICSIKKCYNIMNITSTREEGTTLGGIVGNGWGLQIEECYHIGNITNPSNKGVSRGIIGNGSNVSDSFIKNCYSIGDLTGNSAGGLASGIGIDIFNCYSIGKITTSYCGGTINGMNYGGHIVHCFSRRGDFKTLPEGELTESQIINYLSTYNNTNGYGHSDKAVIGYKCNVLNDSEMKTQEFVDELNNLIIAGSSGENEGVITEESQNVWKLDTNNINNGYPIFQWQN